MLFPYNTEMLLFWYITFLVRSSYGNKRKVIFYLFCLVSYTGLFL